MSDRSKAQIVFLFVKADIKEMAEKYWKLF